MTSGIANFKPIISIIIPTLNSEAKLKCCIDSILSQTYTNFEIIIVDGVSSDGTLKIAQSYNDPRINIHSEPDAGIYDAMNKGIKKAKGEWIYFIGSDDYIFSNDVFYTLLPFFQNCKIDILYGNVIFMISNKKYDGKFNSYKLLNRNICHQSIFVRKTIFVRLGNFELKYNALADWHFNMKWLNNKRIKHRYVESVFAYYYEDGYCFNNPDMNFTKDWDKNISTFFPLITLLLFKNRENKFAKRLIRLLWNE